MQMKSPLFLLFTCVLVLASASAGASNSAQTNLLPGQELQMRFQVAGLSPDVTAKEVQLALDLQASLRDALMGMRYQFQADGLDLASLVTEFGDHPEAGEMVSAASQLLNSYVYWAALAPVQTSPSGLMVSRSGEAFGSFDLMQSKLEAAAAGAPKGSIAWLVQTEWGGLTIFVGPETRSPIALGLKPLVGVRPDRDTSAQLRHVDWQFVSSRL